jgi:hypothetical protein
MATSFSEARNGIACGQSYQKQNLRRRHRAFIRGASINLALRPGAFAGSGGRLAKLPRILEPSPAAELEISATDFENRLQSHNEFWMIAANDQTSSRSRHRSAGDDSREK